MESASRKGTGSSTSSTRQIRRDTVFHAYSERILPCQKPNNNFSSFCNNCAGETQPEQSNTWSTKPSSISSQLLPQLLAREESLSSENWQQLWGDGTRLCTRRTKLYEQRFCWKISICANALITSYRWAEFWHSQRKCYSKMGFSSALWLFTKTTFLTKSLVVVLDVRGLWKQNLHTVTARVRFRNSGFH